MNQEQQKDEKLFCIRHTLSHVLAAAVKELYPEVRLGIGPPTDEGFYYDFLTATPFSATQLKEIEKRMKKIASRGFELTSNTMPVAEARGKLAQQGETLKVELVHDLEAQGEKEVTFYALGQFVDLCRGPHVTNTKELPLKGFKLDRVAGSYWKGNEHNPMLSRIYGLAFHTREELDGYIKQREEAEKRDHRKLGRALDLFVISPEVGKGLPLLTEKGATIRRVLERFIVDEEIRRGYLHVNTPILGRKHLYEISGHWHHYQDSMYPPIDVDGEEYVLRPMTCPHHFMLFSSRPRSYRELPLRLAEISPMYRKERSGELTGLIRVMGFHLADAHIFIQPEDLKQVFKEVIELIIYVMRCLGLTERCWYRVSLKDDAKDKYIDAPESWALSERELLEICEEMELNFVVGKGDAAFYGPKLDVQMRTVGGREETLFTNQIDLAMSERFKLEYVAKDGSRQRPWIVHRSSIGCLERTIAFLTEHYGGAFPTWLAPVQAMVLPITDGHIPFALEVQRRLQAQNIRAELDQRNESLNRKIREARLMKIPYVCVIGDQEQAEEALMVTNRDTGKNEKIAVGQFVQRLVDEDAARATTLTCVAAAVGEAGQEPAA